MDALILSEYLSKIRHAVTSRYEKSELYKELSLSEVRLLMQIYREPNHELATKELAKANKVTLAAIMHKLKLLEAKGFVTKKNSESDQRVKLYLVSSKGVLLAKELKKRTEIYNSKLLESLGEENSLALENILKGILSFLEEH